MISYIQFNGNFYDKESPIFTASNRAFNYGDGLFESMRYTGGHIPFITQHVKRLKKTAMLLKFSIPNDLSTEQEIEIKVEQLLQKNAIKGDARIKIILFRNEGGLYAPENDTSSYVIEVNAIANTNGFELNAKGLKVDLYNEIKKPCNQLSGLKTCNSLLYVLAGNYKREHGFDECVIANEKNNVCEFVSSNLFIVINGVIYTPALTEGCIDGIMRNVVLQIASKNKYNVYETEVKPNDLLRADEIFLTNGVNGIQWVGGYKSKRYFNKISKILIEALNEDVSLLAAEKYSS